jgi:hypothetical protein
MAIKTLRCCGNASLPEQRSTLRAIHTLNPPKKYICKLGGLSLNHSKHRSGAQGLMWGARGAFWPAAAMVVVVVTPFVFCAKATEILTNAIKTLKLVVCKQKKYLQLFIAKHIVIRVLLIVAWPDPKL